MTHHAKIHNPKNLHLPWPTPPQRREMLRFALSPRTGARLGDSAPQNRKTTELLRGRLQLSQRRKS